MCVNNCDPIGLMKLIHNWILITFDFNLLSNCITNQTSGQKHAIIFFIVIHIFSLLVIILY